MVCGPQYYIICILHIYNHKYFYTQSEKSRYYVMHKCICKLCVWVHKGKKKKKHDGIDSSFVCLYIGIDKIFDKIGNHMFLPAYTCQFSLPHHSFFFQCSQNLLVHNNNNLVWFTY